MKFFYKIYLGLTDLPGYGPHPGTGFVFLLILTGALAGVRDDFRWYQPLVGADIVGVVMIPMYLVGAYSRGNEYLRRLKNGQT